jgi:formylglycine-generating enzyme required for sulfatase activity
MTPAPRVATRDTRATIRVRLKPEELAHAAVLATLVFAVPLWSAEPQATAFAPYVETIPGSSVRFEMVPVPAGALVGGAGPVPVRAFWMGKTEVTWDEYDRYRTDRATPVGPREGETPVGADAVTRPTPPYADESFGYGKGKRPVLSITMHAAMEYARWLSEKTGKAYRLPTEAEWEYACRAGQADPGSLGELAWTADDSHDQPHPVAAKKANAWGLFDMLGNVGEWVLSRGRADAYTTRYTDAVRGGSFDDDAKTVTCATRRHSDKAWSRRDPQQPQSIWWHTNATFVGFRLVRPVVEDESLKGLRSRVTRESP